jgi:Putative lumazine-binding
MTKWMTVALLLMSSSLYAQHDTVFIKSTIETFFTGMHRGDTSLIKTSLDSSCFLFSILQKKDSSTLLQEESVEAFLQQVVKLKGQNLEERLLSYDIKTDGAMAIAWTPYTFYFNGQISHCGVNVFSLIKRNGHWRIMGITDTRRKKNCG